MDFSAVTNRFVFLGGLHRSGTSLVFQCLRDHPQISGFANTGVPEDEGQHLQSVYPRAAEFGGAGVFGFAPEAHQTESSTLISPANRSKLLAEWSPHWDLSKPVLLEKTPQNLLQTRLLQALFPDACFILVMRHPVAVAYATRKWSHTSLYSLLAHWVHCHDLFRQDSTRLQRVLVLRYEEFVANPVAVLQRVYAFLGLEFHAPHVQVRSDVNQKYLLQWARDSQGIMTRWNCRHLQEQFCHQVASWGYDFPDTVRGEPKSKTSMARPLSTAVAWMYRGGGAMRRWGSRTLKLARKHVRGQLGIARRRRSAVQ
jgi:hypothetical protein